MLEAGEICFKLGLHGARVFDCFELVVGSVVLLGVIVDRRFCGWFGCCLAAGFAYGWRDLYRLSWILHGWVTDII